MFSKLFKHEIKATSRIFLIAWPALLILALLNGFTASRNKMYVPSGNVFADNFPEMIVMLTFIMVFVAVIVMTFVVVIMRFYKGLLKEEGYLTFTLPVTTRQIITAKGLSATVLVLASGLVGALALMFWILPMCGLADLGAGIRELTRMLYYVDDWPIYAIEFFVLSIISVMASIYQIYAAMSLGQLAQKHKIAFSFVAYVGISIALAAIAGILGMMATVPGMDMLALISSSNINNQAMTHMTLLAYIVLEALKLVAFHVICEYTLDRKLNLE